MAAKRVLYVLSVSGLPAAPSPGPGFSKRFPREPRLFVSNAITTPASFNRARADPGQTSSRSEDRSRRREEADRLRRNDRAVHVTCALTRRSHNRADSLRTDARAVRLLTSAATGCKRLRTRIERDWRCVASVLFPRLTPGVRCRCGRRAEAIHRR